MLATPSVTVPKKISREIRPYPGMPTEGPIGFGTFLQHVNKRVPSKLMTSWSSRVVQNLYWNRAFAHHTFGAMEVTGLTFAVLSEVRTQATSIIKRIALFKTGPTRLAGTCACVTRLAITVDAIQEIGTRNYSSFPEEIFPLFRAFLITARDNLLTMKTKLEEEQVSTASLSYSFFRACRCAANLSSIEQDAKSAEREM